MVTNMLAPSSRGVAPPRYAPTRIAYDWKAGARVPKGLDPQKVGERLERIEAQSSGLTAQAVVDDARPVSSPLHSAFEWEDAAAAEEYRKTQARSLVASVIIVGHLDAPDIPEEPVRGFIIVRTVEEEGRQATQSYVPTTRALADPIMRDQVLDRAKRELIAWASRYRHLNEFANVFAAIGEATGEMD